MNGKPPPPDIVIGRLPIYLRALEILADENHAITSSYELGERLGISSAQIRKDLSHFGDFGKQGTGYEIEFLRDQIRQILKLNQRWQVVVVGAGHMGQALVNYGGFSGHGFDVIGIFDNDPQKIGTPINGLLIQDHTAMGNFVREHGVKLAMIATPAAVAQAETDILVEAGVQAILNYAPITITVPDHVRVQYIDPVAKLQHMTYYLENE